MKKQIIIAALALGAFALGTNNVNAQGKTATATTAVSIELADVLYISTDGALQAVKFEYLTAADYTEKQEIEVENNITVTSSKPFDIKVNAGGATFIGGNIPVSILKLQAISGGKNPMNLTDGPIDLTHNGEVNTLVNKADKGVEKTLNILYSISKGNANEYLLGAEAKTYTQTVTYTATTE